MAGEAGLFASLLYLSKKFQKFISFPGQKNLYVGHQVLQTLIAPQAMLKVNYLDFAVLMVAKTVVSNQRNPYCKKVITGKALDL